MKKITRIMILAVALASGYVHANDVWTPHSGSSRTLSFSEQMQLLWQKVLNVL
jgi:hypothetical protein